MCFWYTASALAFKDIHSFVPTNELLSYVGVGYETMTWLHCVPCPIHHNQLLFSAWMGSWWTCMCMSTCWKTYRRGLETPTRRPIVANQPPVSWKWDVIHHFSADRSHIFSQIWLSSWSKHALLFSPSQWRIHIMAAQMVVSQMHLLIQVLHQ